jgi:predicted esterase
MTHEVHSVAATTHGRVLVRRARVRPVRGVLAGFHGYTETAAIQIARLEHTSHDGAWTLLSVQGLHRFYRGRTQEVGSSWMTKEDRETAIADNLAYVASAVRLVADDAAGIVYAGFSQGVAMAFRAAVLGHRDLRPALGVIAVGGDVPPELLADPGLKFPPIFLARGTRDEWYTAAKFDADVAALRARGVAVEPFVYDGPHDWTPAVSAAAGAWLEAVS